MSIYKYITYYVNIRSEYSSLFSVGLRSHSWKVSELQYGGYAVYGPNSSHLTCVRGSIQSNVWESKKMGSSINCKLVWWLINTKGNVGTLSYNFTVFYGDMYIKSWLAKQSSISLALQLWSNHSLGNQNANCLLNCDFI